MVFRPTSNGADGSSPAAPEHLPAAGATPPAWREIVAPYAKPDARRGIIAGAVRSRRHDNNWASVLGTNAAIAALIATMALTIGLRSFLLAYLPVVLLARTIGIWLFYIQHQFEETYWDGAPRWTFQAAALEGASFYDLPRILHWVTGYIGFHHIHHLSSRISNYQLRDCFVENPELRKVKRLTLVASMRCARLTLWDETSRRLVSFRQARQLARRVRRASVRGRWSSCACCR